MFANAISMASIIHLLLVALSLSSLLFTTSIAQSPNPISRITVVGVVFCDICSSNTFSRHSFFLPGVEVNVQCKFKATSTKTTEQMMVSVNRTTDKHGVYKLEIPHVDGVDCVEGLAMESICKASLLGSKTSACNVPGFKTSTNQITVKSKQDNLCIYSLTALSFKPSKRFRNATLCGNQNRISSLNDSKCIFPFPNFGFPWPFPSLPLPPLPFPSLPPLPSWPFPRIPYPNSPSLPNTFPFSPPSPPPPPPAFSLGDPRTWIPSFPPSPPSVVPRRETP